MAWLTGWSRKQSITIPSSGWSLSGNLTNQPVKVTVPSSNTAFWAGVKADGTDVRFTAEDGYTLLDFEIEKFDNTADDAVYHVEVASLLSASDTLIYVYYSNSGATSGENINGTWDTNYKAVYHLSLNKAAGAFADSTSNANNGTNTGTTDVAGKIDRGRNFLQSSSQYISVADSNSLSFGNGTTDTPLTIEAWVKMTDATGFRVLYKADGSTGTTEYGLSTSGADKLFVALYDNIATVNISKTVDTAFTADEGTWVHIVATYDGSSAHTGITMFKNGASVAATGSTAGTYVAMENTARVLDIGKYDNAGTPLYANGDMDEITISAVARSADWVKARYQSGAGTWTFGMEQLPVSPDTITAADSVSLTAYKTITDSIALTESFLLNGASYVFVTDSVAAVDGALASYKEVRILDTVAGVDIAGSINQNSLMFGVTGFPSGQTAEYRIKTQQGVVIQNWTSVNVSEDEEIPGYSTYTITNIILENGFQGKISWRINGTNYYAVEVLNFFESFVFGQISIDEIEASTILAKDATVLTRLASTSYTAPDNAGIAAIQAKTDNLPQGVQKNTALSNFTFSMVSDGDGKTAATGVTVTARRAIDGGAFASCANSASEIGSGAYKITLAATDLNGDVVTLLFTGSGAVDRVITILTNP